MPQSRMPAVMWPFAQRRRTPLTKAGTVRQDDDPLSECWQLHRARFLERLNLEYTMRRDVVGMIHLLLLILAYMMALHTYDPVADIAAVHSNLRTRYQMEQMDSGVDTPGEVMQYVEQFIKVTYDMASALIDANTMNAIDPMRCFDRETNDVCRLTYWEVQLRREADPNFVNLEALFTDQLASQNYQISDLDCRAENPKPNCMNWTDHVSPLWNHTVMGLTPEDPVIMEKTMEFPFSQVVPLAPIVWQTRAPRVDCDGFGDTYNKDVLGAGSCKPEIRCDPDSVTSFFGRRPNPYSGRHQGVYITYEEDAFYCLDRSKEETVFYDKSWQPWATYEDLKEGKRMHATELLGKDVFYKFISDIRYLQAPVKGTVYFNKSNPCQVCEQWQSPDCIDPLEEGPGHPMWKEESLEDECSGRRQWIKRYLDDTLTPQRGSTFLTSETSEMVVAALVITPQMKGLPDLTTLVQARFSIDQYGVIDAEPELMTVSLGDDRNEWLAWCGVALFLAVTFPSHDWRLHRHYSFEGRRLSNSLINLALACSVCAYVGYSIYVEYSPPFLLAELKYAFATNEQDAYFAAFRAILEYSSLLKQMKQAGFYLMLVLFFRLVRLLDIHPRLGLLSKVAAETADDVFHFLIQFFIMFWMLTFLAFWSFGDRSGQFTTFFTSAYTLFRYFTGDFAFENELPTFNFLVFQVIYVFVVFVMMVNFLLAIVVNGHSKLITYIENCLVEQNVVVDMWDIVKNAYTFRSRSWPAPGLMIDYLRQHLGPDEELPFSEFPAVTAAELARAKWEGGGLPFTSDEDAQDYIDFYVDKLRLGKHEYVLVETRKEMRFLRGHWWGKEDDRRSETRFESQLDRTALAAGSGTASKSAAAGTAGLRRLRSSKSNVLVLHSDEPPVMQRVVTVGGGSAIHRSVEFHKTHHHKRHHHRHGRAAAGAGGLGDMAMRLLVGGSPSLEELSRYDALPSEERMAVQEAALAAFSAALNERAPSKQETEGLEVLTEPPSTSPSCRRGRSASSGLFRGEQGLDQQLSSL